jgi:hypothetical protein
LKGLKMEANVNKTTIHLELDKYGNLSKIAEWQPIEGKDSTLEDYTKLYDKLVNVKKELDAKTRSLNPQTAYKAPAPQQQPQQQASSGAKCAKCGADMIPSKQKPGKYFCSAKCWLK